MKIIRFLILFLIIFASSFLLIGGINLVFNGGSCYFLILGLVYLTASFLLFKNKREGVYLLAFAALATFIWALIERGLNFWPLQSRMMVPLGFTFASILCLTRDKYNLKVIGTALVSFFAFLCLFAGIFFPHNALYANADSYRQHEADSTPRNWTAYGRDNHGTRFSPFTQINLNNVKNLDIAWTYRTGDRGAGIDQNTPLQIDNLVYSCSPNGKIAALDADTGEAVWKFDAKEVSPVWQRCRGLGYFNSTPSKLNKSATVNTDSKTCEERIIHTTNDARLIALDAKTGQVCDGFGQKGYVDLKVGMGTVKPGFYFQTSAPLVAKDTIVIGGWVFDNREVGEPSGVIRGFDANTGALKWAWDLGNPTIDKLPPEGETYTRGTPNSWSTLSFDDQLGLVYVPLGNSTPDYFGAHRSEASNKYSSSLVALDVNTGKEKWHYQTVHYDIWDYDLPSQPTLIDVPDKNGQIVKAVMQTTKRGQIFLLNRETGALLADVVEKPVPAKSSVPEEKPLSPIQPYSVGMPTIGAEKLSENKIWGVTLFDQLVCRIQFKKMTYEGDFTPIGLNKTIQQPGNAGGLNWGSVSFDPKNQIAYVNDIRIPSVFWLIQRKDYEEASKHLGKKSSGHGLSPQTGTPYAMMTQMWMSAIEAPCTEPPYGTISAIDMKKREVLWQVPAGTTQDVGPFGLKSRLPLAMGMPTYAGTSLTAGGLLFFSGTQDYYLRAYEAATGKEVWKYRLPVGSSATPMSYISPVTGKQYIVVSVGGAAQSKETGDYVIAFALKDH